MEIKTTKDLIYEYRDEEHIGGGHYSDKINEPNSKWVKLNDLIKFIKENRIDYDDTKENIMQGDWNNSLTMLKQELEK